MKLGGESEVHSGSSEEYRILRATSAAARLSPNRRPVGDLHPGSRLHMLEKRTRCRPCQHVLPWTPRLCLDGIALLLGSK